MDVILVGKLVVVMLLVIGNAFFVGSEIAITSARRSRIKQLADMGSKSAKIVQLLHNEPTRFYSVTQIGITLVSLALGAIGMVTMAEITDPLFEAMLGGLVGIKTAHTMSYILAFCIISFLHVVAGELAPKILAFHKAEAISLALGGIVNFMYIAFRPIIWVMNHASNGLLWICGQGDIIGGGDGHGHGAAMSEEELRTVIAASAHSHNIPRDTARIINGAFDLSGDKVRSIMVPRVDVKALHETQTFAEALKMFKETNHKRFPVHSGELDNIVGVVSIKSMIHAIEVDPTKAEAVMQTPLKAIMHAPFVVPSNSHISDLLAQFKQQRRQIAIAVNEYGGMEGIITLEDILSDLIGEVQDEFAPHSRKVKKLEGSQWLIDATMRVGDLEPIVNYPFPLNPEYTTLGGLAYTKLGHIPQVGDTVDMDAGRLEVVEMDGHRVTKVKFTDLAVGADGKLQLADAHSAAESDD